MSDVPFLTRQDITEQLGDLYRYERKRHLVAFFGTGIEEQVMFSNMPPFQVVPVRSELELRERMPDLGDDDARVAFLVPWATEIPLDLETIILGGLETEICDRYRTMADLARDLEHYLKAEPIEYKRPSLMRRLGLWVKRR